MIGRDRDGGAHGRLPLGVPLVITVAMLVSLLVSWAPAAQQSARPANWPPARVTGHQTQTAPLTLLGPAGPERTLNISVVLAGMAHDQLDRTLVAISDPSSPQYRHFLTPAQYAQQFGAPVGADALVAGVLRAAGLTVVSRSSDGLLLGAQGTVAQIEALFGVHIVNYRAGDGTVFYSATSAPHLPSALAGIVKGVLGLDNLPLLRPHHLTQRAQPTDLQGFTPGDLAKAYDLLPLYQAGLDGSNMTVALAEIDTFNQSDINTYDQQFGLTTQPVDVAQVDGGGGSPGAGSETTLDIEVLHAIAPKAHIIAYEGQGSLQGFADLFNQAVTANPAQVLSISLGLCEQLILHPDQAPQDLQGLFDEPGQAFFTALDNTFKQADAQGMSVLVSAGDTGAYDCSHLDPNNHTVSTTMPASSPYVTAVGGTALFLNSTGGYGREAGWEDPLEGAGGGGGLSAYYQRPIWQKGPGTDNQFTNGTREVPDVSANADPLTGYAVYDSSSSSQQGGCSVTDPNNSCWTVVGGTSAAAPLWAAITLLADQAAAAKKEKPLGFLDPALYSLAASSGSAPAFHDVKIGGNLLFPATPGWDFSTGLGTPDGTNLVNSLVNLGTASGGTGG